MDFTTVDLYELIYYSPDRFLEFIKPRIKEYLNTNTTTIDTGRINPYETITTHFRIKIKYSNDIKIRKRGRMVFGGIKVEIFSEGKVDLVVNDMFVNVVGKICIDLSKDLCRFYKWERDEKGEFNIGPLDCNKIGGVLHYDTPGDLR